MSGDKPVVILRSKMTYKGAAENPCEPSNDIPSAMVSDVKLTDYEEVIYDSVCVAVSATSKTISDERYFGLEVSCGDKKYKYNVTLDQIVNKNDKKFIKPKTRKISIHTIIVLISFAFVWFLSTIGFAVVYGFYNLYSQAWLSFIATVLHRLKSIAK